MAKKASHSSNDTASADWLRVLNDDAQFDELLLSSLKPVSPPVDFSARVMAAVAAEPTPAPAPAKKARLIRLHWRGWAAGLGTCAAALALFVGVSAGGVGDEPVSVLLNKPAQVAEVIPAMSSQVEKSSNEADPDATTTLNTEQTGAKKPLTETKPSPEVQTSGGDVAVSGDAANDAGATDVPLPVQSDRLVMPRAAYGTETEGSLSTRLLATVEGNSIYQPSFAGRNAVFTTADRANVYSWRVDLSNPSEPQAVAMASWDDLPNADAVLQNTTPAVETTTLVNSPDKTMIAQNSSDGMWISLLDGDVFQLTGEGGGNLVAWAPDSSKLVFTNAEGALFVGYPLERRIYQLADGGVKDVCWHSNNKTLLYVIGNGGDDALYIVETY